MSGEWAADEPRCSFRPWRQTPTTCVTHGWAGRAEDLQKSREKFVCPESPRHRFNPAWRGRSTPWPERFWAKVDKSGDCWEWTGSISVDGYGHAHWPKPRGIANAHRVAYELVLGPIPDGLQIDHLCRNRACVNPDHLEAVTPRVNTLRSNAFTARLAKATHCKYGHPFSPENTMTDERGHRRCRTCGRGNARKWRAALTGAKE